MIAQILARHSPECPMWHREHSLEQSPHGSRQAALVEGQTRRNCAIARIFTEGSALLQRCKGGSGVVGDAFWSQTASTLLV